MNLVLTRHTITEWNSQGRIQGQTDIGLSPEGRAQAQQLALSLAGIGISELISSDLKRAKDTSEIINALLQVPLQLNRGLRECSFGTIEGLTKTQVIERYGSSIEPHWEDQHRAYDFRPYGGEHRDDVLLRHLHVLSSLSDRKPTDTILLVGHGRGMCTLLASLGYLPNLQQGEFRLIDVLSR